MTVDDLIGRLMVASDAGHGALQVVFNGYGDTNGGGWGPKTMAVTKVRIE